MPIVRWSLVLNRDSMLALNSGAYDSETARRIAGSEVVVYETPPSTMRRYPQTTS